MSTNSAIAVRNENGQVKGRSVHWDGSDVGDAVRRIIARDGVEKAVRTLIFDHYGWSSVDGEDEQTLGKFYDDGRFVAVPGYGIAYTTKEGQSSPDRWVLGLDTSIEYFHVIEDDGTVTTYH